MVDTHNRADRGADRPGAGRTSLEGTAAGAPRSRTGREALVARTIQALRTASDSRRRSTRRAKEQR